ncbi:D-glycero-D-manno-heptose 1-phosphate guanosyltransferase [soil metagenome]
MKITQAIILAGGEGTRLREAIPGLPKCLAPIKGRAFIDYLILHLQSQGIEKFVFALGVKSVHVKEYLNQHWPKLDKSYAIETKPLGTGGAIKNAATLVNTSTVLVVNGDTIFKIDLPAAAQFHESSGADCTILLKTMKAFDRYGTVTIDSDGRVTGFREKQAFREGLINAGMYLLNIEKWSRSVWLDAFSFEENYLQQQFDNTNMFGLVQDTYFIDIGIPEDYEKAQTELG